MRKNNMTKLSEQLRARLVFDHLIFMDFAKQEETDFTLFDCMDVEHGGEIENERLAPIHEQLLEAIDCLEELVDLVKLTREGEYEIDSLTTQPATKALSGLKALVEGDGE